MTLPKTSRFSIPLLATGQSHKELFHNEALTLLDFLAHPVVQAIESDPQNLTPSAGECWLVGSSPVGDWSGKADTMACWSENGWHFILPEENMQVMFAGQAGSAAYRNSSWQVIAAIGSPDGGATVDAEARASIDSILNALQSYGILPSLP